MNFCEFINSNMKRKVDFDGVFGAQCVDLFRQYCKDVLGLPHTGGVEGAKDLWLKYEQLPKEKEHFIRVGSGFKYGDVIVWDKTAKNQYGHVALVVSVLDDRKILVFEQDGFKQDGAKFAVRSLDNSLGVLRAKIGNRV